MRNANNKPIENQLLDRELGGKEYRKINQKEISRVVRAARENEREKIGHEIQENLNQVLIAALLYIELAKTDNESLEMCLEKSSLYINAVIKELAMMSHTESARSQTSPDNYVHNAKWLPLGEQEINDLEQKYSIKIGPEHRTFLQILLTIDKKGPDY